MPFNNKNGFSPSTAAKPGLPPPAPASTDALDQHALFVVSDALSALPALTRRVFELYRLGTDSRELIGQRFGLSRGQIDQMIEDTCTALEQCDRRLHWN